MSAIRCALLILALPILATGCRGTDAGGSVATQTPPKAKTVRLKPGHYTFLLGAGNGDASALRLRPGDKIICLTATGAPAGGGGVPTRGHGVGSSTGFSMEVTPGGRVRIVCPAHPGNA